MLRMALAVLMLFVMTMYSKTTSIGLKKAIDKKLVNASMVSLGFYQGYCMNVTVKNVGTDSLVLIVEAGTKFNSLDDKYQDIIVTRQEIIALRKNETKQFKVKGYCCQASNSAPSAGSKYNLVAFNDTNLVKLAQFLNNNNFDVQAEQYAVWAISDCKPIASIAAIKSNSVNTLKQFVAGLKGETLPWYELVTITQLYHSGRMLVIPTRLTGFLTYSMENADYVSLTVKDKNGNPVCFLKSEWLMPSRNQKYQLDVPVSDLSKGKYTIELNGKTQQLAKKEFEI